MRKLVTKEYNMNYSWLSSKKRHKWRTHTHILSKVYGRFDSICRLTWEVFLNENECKCETFHLRCLVKISLQCEINCRWRSPTGEAYGFKSQWFFPTRGSSQLNGPTNDTNKSWFLAVVCNPIDYCFTSDRPDHIYGS